MKLNNNTIKIWDLGFGNPPIGVGLEEVDKDPVTGEWRTDDFAVPYGDGIEKTLDETLDRAYIEVINDKREDPYEPFTPVYAYGLYWFVADDVSTFKKMLGGDKMFNHQITLTEPTKWLERFMVGTKTVTQPVNKEYKKEPVVPTQYDITGYEDWVAQKGFDIPSVGLIRKPEITPKITTLATSSGFIFPNVNDITNLEYSTGYFLKNVWFYFNIDLYKDGVFYRKIKEEINTFPPDPSDPDKPVFSTPEINVDGLGSGNYVLYCRIVYECNLDGDNVRHQIFYYGEYSFSVVSAVFDEENIAISPTIDLLTVADDLLSVAEPLRLGESPRFVLSDAAKDKLRGIIAPEFTFTSATLRECLDQIAKYVNCITRLTVDPYASTVYTIDLDPFDIGKKANMPKSNPDGIVSSRSVEQYASALDSVVENMTVHSDNGSIPDPGTDAFITLRTDSANYRIDESSGFIPTAFPVERLDKLEVAVKDENADTYTIYDITKYVFEASEYRTLSSYSEVYPYSKCFALCYTIGGKNITGLNFEVQSAIWQMLKKPAIVNIINHVSWKNHDTLHFNDLLFRITYIPIVSARVRARRNDIKTESVLNSNQSTSKIDAHSYGRALRGELCRIGNNEKTLQYRSLLYDTELPECGQTYGDGYYISAVKAQIHAGKMDVDISLTKDFNRLSSFIGVRQNIRIEEISKSLAYNRYIIAENSLILTTDESRKSKGGHILTPGFLQTVLKPFLDGKREERQQFLAICTPKKAVTNGEAVQLFDISKYRLPVYAFGHGSSLVFSFAFEDNYSAGKSVATDSYKSGADGKDWYQLQNENRYCDMFGRFDYIGISLMAEGGAGVSYDTEKKEADAMPNATYNLSTQVAYTGANPYLIRKDARERICFTYQVNIYGEDGVIIYNNFAENILSVTGVAYFVFLREKELSKLNDKAPAYAAADKFKAEVVTNPNGEVTALTLAGGKIMEQDYDSWFVIDGDDRILFGANQKTKKGEGKTVYFVMEK